MKGTIKGQEVRRGTKELPHLNFETTHFKHKICFNGTKLGNGLIPKHWALFRRRIMNSCIVSWLGGCRTESPDEPHQSGCLFSDQASQTGSDLTSFDDFAKLMKDFHFAFNCQMVCL